MDSKSDNNSNLRTDGPSCNLEGRREGGTKEICTDAIFFSDGALPSFCHNPGLERESC